MNKFQSQVIEFHEKFSQPIGHRLQGLQRHDLRAKLIEEEAKETADAIRRGDFTEAVDGLCDLIYVACGAATEFGVDLEPYFNEVHKTNMLKDGGPTRNDGKILKPKGWIPPQIAEMLKAGIGRIK